MVNLKNINSSAMVGQNPHQGLVVISDMNRLIQQFKQTPEYKKNDHSLTLEDEHFVDLFVKLLIDLHILGTKLQPWQLPIEHSVYKYNSEIYYIVQNISIEFWLDNAWPLDQDLQGYSQQEIEVIWNGYIGEFISRGYYGLTPSYSIYFQDIQKPLLWLEKLWYIPAKEWTTRHQLMNNYCIQIILAIISTIKHSVQIVHKCYQNYDKYPTPCIDNWYARYWYEKYWYKNHWNPDFLFSLCANVFILIEDWNTGHIWFDLTRLFVVHQSLSDGVKSKYLILSQAQIYYFNKYPWLQLQFEHPLEYFTPWNTNDFFPDDLIIWIMFANVPNTAKYKQLLEIRGKLHQICILLNDYDNKQAQNSEHITRENLWGECAVWNKIQNLKITNDNNFKVWLQEHQHVEQRYDNDEIFQQICTLYMQVFAQPLWLLEELYHQAREKRAQLTGGATQGYKRVGLYKNKNNFNPSGNISNICSIDIKNVNDKE